MLSCRDKAVAIGAVSYYVDHFVKGRISKFTYGVLCHTLYDPTNPEHVRRAHKSYVDAMGDKYVPGYFETMLPRVRHVRYFLAFELNSIPLQGTKVLEDREIRHEFCWSSEGTPPQQVFHIIAKYIGSLVTPEWEDIEEGRVFDSLVPCEERSEPRRQV